MKTATEYGVEHADKFFEDNDREECRDALDGGNRADDRLLMAEGSAWVLEVAGWDGQGRERDAWNLLGRPWCDEYQLAFRVRLLDLLRGEG